VLVVGSVVIVGADRCSWLFGRFDDVENFVAVGVVVDRLTLLVVMPLLVLVSSLVAVDHQKVGAFHNETVQLIENK